jgi:hypothetical protein
MVDTHCSNLLTKQFCTVNLLHIRGGREQGFSQSMDSEFPDSRSNAQRFNAVSPEELITKERSYDGRNPGCEGVNLGEEKA